MLQEPQQRQRTGPPGNDRSNDVFRVDGLVFASSLCYATTLDDYSQIIFEDLRSCTDGCNEESCRHMPTIRTVRTITIPERHDYEVKGVVKHHLGRIRRLPPFVRPSVRQNLIDEGNANIVCCGLYVVGINSTACCERQVTFQHKTKASITTFKIVTLKG